MILQYLKNRKSTMRWLLYYPSTWIHVSALWFLLPFIFLAIVTVVNQVRENKFPRVKSATKTPLDTFSEDRAMQLFTNLTRIGPRITGTEAEYNCIQFMKAHVDHIYRLELSDAQRSMIRLEMDEQMISNEYPYSPYQRNIIYRLSSSNMTLEMVDSLPSIMIASHFDSVVTSPGGADDGAGFVVGMELLRNALNSKKDIKYPIIFLFTDMEESGLLGARWFVQEPHKWAKSVKRFLNVDASGTGRAIMVRSAPEIMKEYCVVPHPHTTVIATEAIERMNQDTDFTAFSNKKALGLKGLDFAFYQNGYHYHTRMDEPSHLAKGSILHLGDNMQALLTSYSSNRGNVMEKSEPKPSNKNFYIYYDVLGYFVVRYSQVSSDAIHVLLMLVIVFVIPVIALIDHVLARRITESSIFSRYKCGCDWLLISQVCRVSLFTISYILSFAGGIVFAVIGAVALSKINPLSWYSHPTLAIFYYGLLCIIGMMIVQALASWAFQVGLCFKRRGNEDQETQIPEEIVYYSERDRYFALLIFWAIMCLISICSRVRSLYFIPLWTLFNVVFVLGTMIAERICITILYLTNCVGKRQFTQLYPEHMDKKFKYNSGNSGEYDEFDDDDDMIEEQEQPKLSRKDDHQAPSSYYSLFLQDGFSGNETKRVKLIRKVQVHLIQAQWAVIPFVAALIPTMISYDAMQRFYSMIVPLMGLISPKLPMAEVLVACWISFFICLCTVSLLPVMNRALNFGKIIVLLAVALLVTFLVACFISPFDKNTPDRLSVRQPSVINLHQSITSTTFTVSHRSSSLALLSAAPIDLSKFLKKFKAQDKSFDFYCDTTTLCLLTLSSALLDQESASGHMQWNSTHIVTKTAPADDGSVLYSVTVHSSHAISSMSEVSVYTDNSLLVVDNIALNPSDPFTGSDFYATNATSHSIRKFNKRSGDWILDIAVTDKDTTQSKSLFLNYAVFFCEDNNASVLLSKLQRFSKSTMIPIGSFSCRNMIRLHVIHQFQFE